MSPIPITVFTGFLGAGKTSVILSLLPKLPEDYKVVLLKNEFGDVEVDSKLAQQSSLTAVSEILNGCMCCVLVGQMQNALIEIRDNYRPDRIIIECSGSAFPATLAFQIRQLEKDTGGDFSLDAIVTVIDAENFTGYEDTSPTARMQASYSDIILINKWEHVSEREFDIVMDHLHTLNDATPKIKCQGRNGVDPGLIFGLQSTQFLTEAETEISHDEVETLTLGSRGILEHQHGQTQDHHADEWKKEKLLKALEVLPRDTIWRVKGFVKLEGDGWYIMNWAFGRNEFLKVEDCGFMRMTVMGSRGDVRRGVAKFVDMLLS
ncbi:hypothetical protein D9613_007705 [Agrocybe pediades]|uniref:CobW/HypB/UreG nucleotide-binding domain-containing protein n=1 Tax=Agrocybe pediades TaxID=84607 RepID=A0A8H4QNA3_9AGAR|nr:hypothetical protein D9613_007705 [Agrocybe pediades]